MTYNQLNAKVDGNQAQIVAELRALGFDVDLVHRLKKLYDILVTGYDRRRDCVRALRVEIKMPKEKLTDDEREYWEKQKHRENLMIATSTNEVLHWFGWEL